MEDEKKPPTNNTSDIPKNKWPWLIAGMGFMMWQLWSRISDKDALVLSAKDQNIKCYVEQRDEYREHEKDTKNFDLLSSQLLRQNDSLKLILHRRDSAGKDHMRREP